MASHPSSELPLLARDGSALAELPEWEPAFIVLPVEPIDLDSTTVRRHDLELPVVVRQLAGRTLVVAEWPRSGTGHYRLDITTGTAGHPRVEATLTIRPRKISEDAFARLLDDLESDLPASVAIALQRLGALSGIKLLPPAESTLAQELVRLQRAVRGHRGRLGLAKTLPALALDPHKVLVSSDVWVPRERARRIHPASLPRAFSAAHNIEADRLPRRVPELRVEHTVDVYENRLVKMFHGQVDRRLRRLINALELSGNAEQTEAAAHLLTQLTNARRAATFLDEVASLTYLPDHLTMVLLRRPEYRAVLEGYLNFRRVAGVRLEEPGLEAPLENLPALYEVWGTLQVIRAALEVAESSDFVVTRQRLAGRDSSGVFLHVLRDGRAALVLRRDSDSTTVELFPQRTYGRTGPLRTISFPQKPDVAVEISRGDERWVVIFDPKYKLQTEEAGDLEINGRPKKEDIDKMHAYRDAIRTEAGARVVEYAAILYPGPLVSFSQTLEALPAYPGVATALDPRLEDVLRTALSPSQPSEANSAAHGWR
jgi:hypothetical protein